MTKLLRKEIWLPIVSIIVFLLVSEIILRVVWFQLKSEDLLAVEKAYFKLWDISHIFLQENFTNDVTSLDGITLNKRAWESSYKEIGLNFPGRGPREGYWEKRIFPKGKYPGLNYIEKQVSLDTLLQIKKHGLQFSSNFDKANVKILILGGSVAFGAYASSINKTYFEIFSKLISNKDRVVGVATLAAGGWTSHDELTSFVAIGLDTAPDFILLLDGVNDLTEMGGEYEKEIENYRKNVQKIIFIASQYGIKPILAPQPFVEFRKFPTGYERRILEIYSNFNFKKPYNILLTIVRDLACSNNIPIIDCSSIFANERQTVFIDYWHFSDYAQNKLAHYLANNFPVISTTYGN